MSPSAKPGAVRALGALLLAALLWAAPAAAERAAQMQLLIESLRLGDTARIMRAEGRAYGQNLAQGVVPEAETGGWMRQVERIHDVNRMQQTLSRSLGEALADVPLAPLIAFFTSPVGRRVVARELAAREALLDPEAEAAARENYAALARQKAPIIARIETLISDSDLIERNLTGILNADLMLYRGLVDGGLYDLSEEQILRVVGDEADTVRSDGAAWLRAYLLLTYRPLAPDDLDRTIAFWRSAPGRALNRALFASFDGLYEQLSYLLGQSLARYMRQQKL